MIKPQINPDVKRINQNRKVMRKTLLLASLAILGTGILYADDYNDDIYYNPKKTKKTTVNSNYNPNFSNQDVDAYNRRGQYYVTPIDTIGTQVENGEDFVYTQQIQKFYNPTIVVDNSDLLYDILNNSYGNIDVVYANGNPFFSPLYTYPYANIGWNLAFGDWGWNFGYYRPYYSSWYGWYNPWYGPSWSWGPSWALPSWGWGPSYGWDWGWAHYPHHTPGWLPPHYPKYHVDYRPGGNSVAARPGWSGTTRPNHTLNSQHSAANTRPGGNLNTRPVGGNSNLSHGSTRPSTTRPGSASSSSNHNTTTRPATTTNGVTVNGYNQSARPGSSRPSVNTTTTSKPAVNTNTTNSGSSKRGGYQSDSKKAFNGGSFGTSTAGNSNVNSSSGSHRSSGNNYNSGSSNRSSGSSYNSGSSSRSGGYSTGSSRGGYSGGGRSSGGGGGRSGGRR